MKKCLLTSLILPLFFFLSDAAADRQELLDEAIGAWVLGTGGAESEHPLEPVGDIRLGVPADGEGAGSRNVARLNSAYFNAGNDLSVTGNQMTVYLRVRDPYGQWMHALMAKRGRHETINFNLFSADFEHTQGPDIGFELHTDVGLATCSFPVSDVGPRAWHDIVGRYDGRRIELICDGVVMDRLRWKGELTQNREPLLIGAQTDEGKVEAPFTGEMEEAALWDRALSDEEVAMLVRKDKIVSHPKAPDAGDPYESPIHYRPPVVKMGDTIPFYWEGEYHIFYLRATAKMAWGHIVSTDLVNWTELPFALVPDGPSDGPTAENSGTGSILETNGVFHAYYTAWNPRNPKGREFALHATSTNLVDWVKHPEHICGPDGVLYKDHHDRDFRDPYIFWNEEDQCYWMLIYANDGKTGVPVVGVFTSADLKSWTPRPPIASFSGQECPDYFQIGNRHYLIGAFRYAHAEKVGGPYRAPDNPYLDTPFLYAGKRMFDGQRHVWTAWFRDLAGEKDGGSFEWGGSQCLPREIYAGPGGELYARPVDEVVAVFTNVVFDLATHPPAPSDTHWERDGTRLVGQGQRMGSQHVFDVPDHYMLQCRIELDPHAEFTLALREQATSGYGYRLVLRPAEGEAEISGRTFSYPRRCVVDASQPIEIQAFVQGTMIETFINDQYAFSCRAYDFSRGKIGLNVAGGQVRVLDLVVKTHE